LVPGLWTTAHLLLCLFLGSQPLAVPLVFDRIMPAIYNGDYPCGVIIHEGRFTYAQYGLECLLDLGQWWEEKTGCPIPLGGIAIKRELSAKIANQVESIIRDSLAFSVSNPQQAMPYITSHAQEMDPHVIQQHIDLYVNDFSLNIGREGSDAVKLLFSLAQRQGLLPSCSAPIFACD
jgi:1,4-dihydroxy-6-naphthoate synthase